MSTINSNTGESEESAQNGEESPAQPARAADQRRLGLHDFTRTAMKAGASDIHLQAGSIPMIRIDGRARFLDCPPSTDADLEEYLNLMLKEDHQRKTLHDRGSVDLAYLLPDGSGRFRCSVFHSRGKYATVMRRIVTKIPDFDEINLPKQI